MPTQPSPSSSKVLLGLSGNMLSSVVAALLKHQGFQVTALHFQVDEATRAEAERVAKKLGLNLIVEDAAPALEEYVRDHIVHQTLANAQAEPTLMGHQKIVIEGLLTKARELGCGMIATGHAARVVLDPSTGLTRLARAADLEHDQSHLLFQLRAEELKQFVLPAGDLNSGAVERLAIELELDPEKLKNPSQGFCFIPEERFLAITEPRIPPTMKIPGQIKSPDGTVIADHDGLFRYRRGQILALKGKTEGLFILGMVHGTQTLIAGPEEQLMAREATLSQANWIQKIHPIQGFSCEARLHQGALAKCRVTPFEHGYLHVEFEQPQKNIIPGQAIVFYRGDEVLGGGFAT